MGENVTERDEHVFEDTEVRPAVVYQPQDDGTSLVLGQEFRTKEKEKSIFRRLHIRNAAGRELHLSEYCSKYYLVEQWALAYHRTIYPVPHMSDWVIPEDVKAKKILPPDFDKKKGKPQQTRFPSVGESRGRGQRGR
uniref:Uncharacterized protein n=1 Tax=Brassica oleracea TaxID=3712 RepID=A0A3P6FY90_BRAOL|nr:unnamed protein product [Brassica oleracea]